MVVGNAHRCQSKRPNKPMTEHKARSSRPAQGGHSESQALSPRHQALSPSGAPMTIEDLPPPGTKRWVIRRKAEVVAGVRGGLITLEQACRRYRLSVDEFRSWERLLRAHGLPGLRITRVKKYRRPRSR